MSRPLMHMMIRLTLLLGLTIGLVGVGFAHRTAPPMDPQLAAFFEVGGTLADLCDEGSPISHWDDGSCEACRLTDTALDTDAFEHRRLTVLLQSAEGLPRQSANEGEGVAQPYAARAPPVV